MEVGMTKRLRKFRELNVEQGFTSVQFVLESSTPELVHRGLLITSKFSDLSGSILRYEEVSSSFSNALQTQFQYIEKIDGVEAIFRTKPFYMARPACGASIAAMEWGDGFTSDDIFEEAISGLWAVFRNSRNGIGWTYRMELE